MSDNTLIVHDKLMQDPEYARMYREELEEAMSEPTPTCPHGETEPHTIQRNLPGGIVLEIICDGPQTDPST